MSSNAYDVQIPATEIEIAEAIRCSDPDTADTIRRLAFQRDEMLEALEFLLVPDHPIFSDSEMLRKAREKARAVVAKAKGMK